MRAFKSQAARVLIGSALLGLPVGSFGNRVTVSEPGFSKSGNATYQLHSVLGESITGVSTNANYSLHSGSIMQKAVQAAAKNDAPYFISPSSVVANANEAFDFTLQAVDPENASLTYSAPAGLPEGFTLEGNQLSSEALGADTVSILLQVSDSFLSDSITLTINPDNTIPNVVSKGVSKVVNFTHFPVPAVASHGNSSDKLSTNLSELAEMVRNEGGVVLAFSNSTLQTRSQKVEAVVSIFDIVGNEVYRSSVVEGIASDGESFGFLWNGRTDNGYAVSPGSYVAVLSWTSGTKSGSHKTVITIKKD